MISATGNLKRRTRGFTIIEVVLVIGLIALAGAIVITNFASMADRGGDLSTEETLSAAIRKARFDAAKERSVVTMWFDDESGALALSSGADFPLGPEFTDNGRNEIRFYVVPPARGLSPFNDAETTQIDVKEVSFAPDRSSSPFAVEIDTAEGSPERIVFDPFSSLKRKSK
jgi:type II secretory pathway pseudopilin PulG